MNGKMSYRTVGTVFGMKRQDLDTSLDLEEEKMNDPDSQKVMVSVANPKPHHLGKLDPDPHQSE
jgi:hypothetical protein